MRITLVISSLGTGGAERVMSVMASYWAENGQDVSLITLASSVSDFYALHPAVKRIGLGLLVTSSHRLIKAALHNIQRLKQLRKEILASRPDVVLSFVDTTNILTLLASFRLGVPVIVAEHTDPRHHPVDAIWTRLRYLLYPRANAVVVLTQALRTWAEEFLPKNIVHVIPNPVPAELLLHHGPVERKGHHRTIVAMGHLTPLKGFDILLNAFARCAAKHSDWSLVILGEGEERGRLRKLAIELGVSERVRMPGRMPDPFQILRGADLFVLSSRYEGFPMALLEAMACRVAVICTEYPSGPGEIIRNGVDGVLVPTDDIDALAAAMDRLIVDPLERQRLASRAVEVREKFGLEKVMQTWDLLITQACSSHGSPKRQSVQAISEGVVQ
jgi:glycosyltransferase involved in cell wall biosynthesis